jgi:hypothetical protein
MHGIMAQPVQWQQSVATEDPTNGFSLVQLLLADGTVACSWHEEHHAIAGMHCASATRCAWQGVTPSRSVVLHRHAGQQVATNSSSWQLTSTDAYNSHYNAPWVNSLPSNNRTQADSDESVTCIHCSFCF